jgi:catechol 2,3-dioxygenase-like lactoylglutathione lyase family enzyme
MLDHISFGVSDMAKSAQFYDAVLKPLGYTRQMEVGDAIAYGSTYPCFWIAPAAGADAGARRPGFHLALQASGRPAVDAFYKAAMENDATDDGAPGLRPQYTPTYYAAFVIDPDGYKIEAVTYVPE